MLMVALPGLQRVGIARFERKPKPRRLGVEYLFAVLRFPAGRSTVCRVHDVNLSVSFSVHVLSWSGRSLRMLKISEDQWSFPYGPLEGRGGHVVSGNGRAVNCYRYVWTA